MKISTVQAIAMEAIRAAGPNGMATVGNRLPKISHSTVHGLVRAGIIRGENADGTTGAGYYERYVIVSK